ncbi:Gfo/Idh/MocA family protein [Dictyobacter kobayashii]|uniref:Dehydrogenase n=1 Tax=Dictyobacter kobayashii TaxID=2014872 RepID=A0A402AKV8_9CHLR|nr:Gfo/Idh/MocA family oxidoreductase [Dictyobacter kobayashii]GCE19858.1 dehydrogenase [Dictyobacter kobayashii]
MPRTKIGIIGCGKISGIYLEAGKHFENIEVAACADIDMNRARSQAAAYGIPRACTVEEILADPEIEIIVNLTIPKVHAEVALAAIEAGKSVYGEKPLAVNRAEGRQILAAARTKGVRVGSAPDTFLGGGLQTCRKLIDDGAIGEPVSVSAAMLCHGHENWHPDPEFYYQPGGGPLFDMGPYYLTALVSMLGPIRRVTGSARVTFPERVITSQPKNGQKIQVKTPTHIAGVMDFASGAVGTLVTSFDVWAANIPLIEIYGTEGTLSVPDPNSFGGPVKIWTLKDRQWHDVELTHGYTENSRGLGVSDMAQALRSGRAHRANGELAYHVLDAMQAYLDASLENKHIELESSCERPAALPVGLANGQIDH